MVTEWPQIKGNQKIKIKKKHNTKSKPGPQVNEINTHTDTQAEAWMSFARANGQREGCVCKLSNCSMMSSSFNHAGAMSCVSEGLKIVVEVKRGCGCPRRGQRCSFQPTVVASAVLTALCPYLTPLGSVAFIPLLLPVPVL